MDEIISTLILQGLPALCGGLLVHCWDKVNALKDRQEKRDVALRLPLRLELRRMHAYAVEKGYVTYSEQAIADEIYTAYHNLGGNGQGTHLIEAIHHLPVKKEP